MNLRTRIPPVASGFVLVGLVIVTALVTYAAYRAHVLWSSVGSVQTSEYL